MLRTWQSLPIFRSRSDKSGPSVTLANLNKLYGSATEVGCIHWVSRVVGRPENSFDPWYEQLYTNEILSGVPAD